MNTPETDTGVLFCPDALVNEVGAIFHLDLLLFGSPRTLAHFLRLSCGIIFSGAVAFIGPDCATQRVQISPHRKITRKGMPLDDVGAFMSPNDQPLRKLSRRNPECNEMRDAHNVRFGSKADMCSAKSHVRFTPKADMCSATRYVRFVPIADIQEDILRKQKDRLAAVSPTFKLVF